MWILNQHGLTGILLGTDGAIHGMTNGAVKGIHLEVEVKHGQKDSRRTTPGHRVQGHGLRLWPASCFILFPKGGREGERERERQPAVNCLGDEYVYKRHTWHEESFKHECKRQYTTTC